MLPGSQVAPHLAKDACVVSCTSGLVRVIFLRHQWSSMHVNIAVGHQVDCLIVSTQIVCIIFFGGIYCRCPCSNQATLPLLEGEVWCQLLRNKWTWTSTLLCSKTCGHTWRRIVWQTNHRTPSIGPWTSNSLVWSWNKLDRFGWQPTKVHLLDCPVSGGPRGAAAGWLQESVAGGQKFFVCSVMLESGSLTCMLGSDSEEATKKVLPVLNTFAQKAVLLRKCVFSILDHNRVSTIAFQLGTFDWTSWRVCLSKSVRFQVKE